MTFTMSEVINDNVCTSHTRERDSSHTEDQDEMNTFNLQAPLT